MEREIGSSLFFCISFPRQLEGHFGWIGIRYPCFLYFASPAGKHKAESRWFGANSWGSWRNLDPTKNVQFFELFLLNVSGFFCLGEGFIYIYLYLHNIWLCMLWVIYDTSIYIPKLYPHLDIAMVGALRHGIFAGPPSTSSMASCYGAPGSSSCSAGGAKGKDSLVKTSFFFP